MGVRPCPTFAVEVGGGLPMEEVFAFVAAALGGRGRWEGTVESGKGVYTGGNGHVFSAEWRTEGRSVQVTVTRRPSFVPCSAVRLEVVSFLKSVSERKAGRG